MTTMTSQKDQTVFENSNIFTAIKGLKAAVSNKVKKSMVPVITVYT